jgi:hypothetical protein
MSSQNRPERLYELEMMIGDFEASLKLSNDLTEIMDIISDLDKAFERTDVNNYDLKYVIRVITKQGEGQ